MKMEEEIRKKIQEKIKNKAVFIGLNSTLRGIENGEVELVVYASNVSESIKNELSESKVKLYAYDGDNEALSIACGKSFNISVLGLKK